MERTLTYTTDHFISPQPVSHFLKQKGFSSQNLVQLKKDPTGGAAAGYHLRGRGSHGDQ